MLSTIGLGGKPTSHSLSLSLPSFMGAQNLGLGTERRSMPLRLRGRASRCRALEFIAMYLDSKQHGRTFYHHCSSRQQPDYVSPVDKSGLRKSHTINQSFYHLAQEDKKNEQIECLNHVAIWMGYLPQRLICVSPPD